MKRLLCILGSGVLALAPAHALQLRLTSPEAPELLVLGEDGKDVVRVAAGTVGQAIDADGQAFVLSFGEDADGTWVAVLSPASPQPKDFELKVESQLPIVLRSIESGLVGAVMVKGRRLPAGMMWMAGGSVAGPVPVSAREEATVTVRWVGPGSDVETNQPLDALVDDKTEPGAPEFIEFAQPDQGLPTGQVSPVADPEILTLPYKPVINPILLGPDLTPT